MLLGKMCKVHPYNNRVRDAAYDDYAFVKGRQWSEADTKKLKAQNRPVITINRCRPIINLLCGYAAQNETEPDFATLRRG